MDSKKKILVVDDETEYLSILNDALSMRGYDVTTASNAIDAGLYLSSRHPDLLLMDLNMPGINGFQAIEALKRNPQTKSIPLIIVSALSDEPDISKAKSLGAVDYFVKPVNIAELVSKIRDLLT